MGTTTQASLLLVTIAAAIGSYIYHRKRKVNSPGKWQEVGKVKRLNLYPLKSGHRLEVDRAECTEVGLRQTEQDEQVYQLRDRGLVVYNEQNHEFRTARTYPNMVLIDVSVHDVDHLAVDAPTMRTLYVKIPSKNEYNESSIKLHKEEDIYSIDCGDEAAFWFSRYILQKDSGLRLGYHDASCRRDITKTHQSLLQYYKNLCNESTGLYSDLSSVMIINQASVYDLNKKIGNSSVTVDNFRPNIVVDGPNIQPYAEDEWDWIKIGDVVLRNVKECTRCILTTIDPENGNRSSDREPLKTLETYRMSTGPNKLPVMGINLGVSSTGFISVNDTVYAAKNKE